MTTMGDYDMICENCIFFSDSTCLVSPKEPRGIEGCDPACDLFRYNYLGRKFRAKVAGVGRRTLTRGVTGSYYYKKSDGRHIEVEKLPGEKEYRIASRQVL